MPDKPTELLNKLEGAYEQESSGNWLAQCPAHADQTRSLLIWHNDKTSRWTLECLECNAAEVDVLRIVGLKKDALRTISETGVPFAGRSHAEVLDMEFGDEPPDLIDGLVPRGVVVTTAGLPETYKGWVCTKKAQLIAQGEGEIFGCAAVAQGPVGYFWQDDSTRNEAERIQLYAAVHATPRDLPIRWYLNEDLQLPRDIDRLRLTIEHHGFVYVVLDSFYNIAAEIDLKDRAGGIVFALLKTEVCDPTGCTVDIVDHMAWATDVNRKRTRSYGDVFKNAAARAGLYIDAEGTKLYVEARGNNIKGIKRTPAYWDETLLELRLVEVAEVDYAGLTAEVAAYVRDHPGESTTAIAKALGKRAQNVRKALESAEEAGRLNRVVSKPSRDLGRPGTGKYWFPHKQAESEPSGLFGTAGTAQGGDPEEEAEPSRPSPPVRRDGSDSGRLNGSEIDEAESLLERHADIAAEPPSHEVDDDPPPPRRPQPVSVPIDHPDDDIPF